jgi:hypothetical protein
MRKFEPDRAFPPILRIRLVAGDPYLSAKQVAFLVERLRGQEREQLADSVEAAFEGSGAFSPTAEEKVELLRIVCLWSPEVRADHRVAALLQCLQRDTGLSGEPTVPAGLRARLHLGTSSHP